MEQSDVYIHAGAHRTGTSSFQLFLAANAALIRARGHDLAYPGRDDIPGGTLRLRLPGAYAKPKRKQQLGEFLVGEMQRHVTAPGRPLILSEENIPGQMMHFFGGEFFPGIRRRLKALREVLPGPVRRLVYVVRPYDELFVSAYRKTAEDNAVQPFDEVGPVFAGIQGGWPHVVSALRDVLAPEVLIVRPYENRGSNADLFRLLVPDMAGADLVEPPRVMNRSATDAALMALQLIYARGEKLARPEWQKVIADFAADRTPRGFAVFDDGQVARMRDRYLADLTELRSMPGITLSE